MALINLLPWREELRQQRNRDFYTAIAAFLMLGAIASGLMWIYFNNRLENQQQANALITSRSAALDSQLASLDGLQERRDAIIERTKIISDLQSQRPIPVRLMDEMARLVPANLYLTKFERKGNQFLIEGRAESPNTVSEFLRNLEASPWFRNAFMNSFTGVTVQTTTTVTSTVTPAGTPAPVAVAGSPMQVESGGVLPRPEAGYGTFNLTMDLEEQSAEQLLNPPPGVMPALVAGTTVTTTEQTVTTQTTTPVTPAPVTTVPVAPVPATITRSTVTPVASAPAVPVNRQTSTVQQAPAAPVIVVPPANSINAPVSSSQTVTTTVTNGGPPT